jgi:hypothetical protein
MRRLFAAVPPVRVASPARTPMITVPFLGYVRFACDGDIALEIGTIARPDPFVPSRGTPSSTGIRQDPEATT